MRLLIDEYPQLRFCRISKGTKKPFEEGWTNKPYTWEEISKFFPNENYGVLCGYGNLAVIDSDKKELQDVVDKKLPPTYKVKTGSGGTHNYYFIPELKNKIILEIKLVGDMLIHFGEVQSYGSQVVGVGSIHPNGNTYSPLNENEIATIELSQLYDAIKPFRKEIKETEEAREYEKKNYGSKIDELRIINVWGISNLKKQGDEFYGSHPIHGSEGGMNFWINPSKNLWHCFRCNSGGGILSAIAVKEGIISCSEAQKGFLRGDKAIEAINIAKEKYGLKEDYQIVSSSNVIVPEVKNFEFLWEHELDSFKEDDKEWIIDKIIPSKSVGVWTGKRGTFKTFLVLNAIFSVASGNPFVGKFATKQGKVIYLDKENGIPIMRCRKNMIKKGMNLDGNLDVGFICFSQLKIDKQKDIEELRKLIEEHKPSLLIVDTYRRGISFEENDAGEVSKLFVDTLRPLVEKYNMSIILIHHDRKGQSEGDEMDMIRGSSDLANYADFVIKNDRQGSKIILKQLKMRNAPELPPMDINIETDNETTISFLCSGEHQSPSKEDKAIEALLIWIETNKFKEFRTKDAQEFALDKGIKRNSLFNGLAEMESKGIINKSERGVYKVNEQHILVV